MWYKLYLYTAVLIIVVMAVVIGYEVFAPLRGPIVFSPLQVLGGTWENYKREFVDQNYRTIDTARNNITTSEGQSYTMLRAVWQGDQTTFDGSWAWTKRNLMHTNDHLFSWLWGTRPNGSLGVLTTQNGANAASDADTDIAVALMFAYSRWQNPTYLSEARNIVSDIWKNEVIFINGLPVLAADDVEKNAKTAIVVNPSYFNPAAYHLFALIDPAHAWESLRSNSYTIIGNSAVLPLVSAQSVGLPPNWIVMDRTTGEMTAPQIPGYDTHFGFDALRIPFRIALDATWFNNTTAISLLKRFTFLSSAYKENGRLAGVYAHDGSIVLPDEVSAMYGGTIGYFMFADPPVAQEIYRNKLLTRYDPNASAWTTQLSYYDDNWTWFGIALYAGLLPNLAADVPISAFRESPSK